MRSPHITVTVSLDCIRESAQQIRTRTGVRLMAVIKADAYGLGAAQVSAALEDIADEFAFFSVHEARELGRPGLVLGPVCASPAEYAELGLRPTIATRAEADEFAKMPVAINLDTGMQRFGCSAEDLPDIVAHSQASEIYTHANDVVAVQRLRAIAGGFGVPLHAASTSLLDVPATWLDAIRPGLALYRGSVRVTTRLITVREPSGPAGYTRFTCPRVGVLLGGYANLLMPGPVVINGRRQRLLEIGMNTSFVSVAPGDKVGDEVVLLGYELDETELAQILHVRPHEVLCRYCRMGVRQYLRDGKLI